MTGQDRPTKISFVYSNPTDPDAFETAYPTTLPSCRSSTVIWWRSAKISTSLSRSLIGSSRSNPNTLVTAR
jgi:hypothetical protein